MYTFALNKKTYIININKAKKLSEGNEGIIYEIDNKLLFKLYKKPDYLKMNKVYDMVNYLATHPQSCVLKYSSWPIALVYNENRVQVGYIMKRFEGKKLDLLGGLQRTNKNFKQFSTKDLFDVSINLIEALETMRKEIPGLIVGDFSAMNVLVNENKEICYIDMDSICFHQYPCQVATQGYKAYETMLSSYPNLVFTYKTDDFLIALITFSIITGYHPYSNNSGKSLDYCVMNGMCALLDDQYKKYRPIIDYPYKNLFTQDVIDLYKHYFIDGCKQPLLRPSLSQLKQALIDNKNTLKQCRKNKKHQYSKVKCPYCNLHKNVKKNIHRIKIRLDSNKKMMLFYIIILLFMGIGMVKLYASYEIYHSLYLIPVLMLFYALVTLNFVYTVVSALGYTMLSFWVVAIIYEMMIGTL